MDLFKTLTAFCDKSITVGYDLFDYVKIGCMKYSKAVDLVSVMLSFLDINFEWKTVKCRWNRVGEKSAVVEHKSRHNKFVALIDITSLFLFFFFFFLEP